MASCNSSPGTPVADGYRTPDTPPECRAAVNQDPEVRRLRIAGAAVPIFAAQNQNDLAFAEAQAERKCLRDKGLMQGGVEPVRHIWYASPF